MYVLFAHVILSRPRHYGCRGIFLNPDWSCDVNCRPSRSVSVAFPACLAHRKGGQLLDVWRKCQPVWRNVVKCIWLGKAERRYFLQLYENIPAKRSYTRGGSYWPGPLRRTTSCHGLRFMGQECLGCLGFLLGHPVKARCYSAQPIIVPRSSLRTDVTGSTHRRTSATSNDASCIKVRDTHFIYT